MKPMSRFVLGFITCAALVTACSQLQQPAAASSALPLAVTAQSATSAAAPLVALPDFTALVEHAGPAVVNIEATLGGRGPAQEDTEDNSQGDDQQQPGDEDMPEFFKRFFGPNGPRPPAPQGPERGGTSFGSGFIISADGYVLTNHHVIDGANQVIVHLADRRELTAKVIGSDASSDIALLKIDAGGLPVLQLGDSRNLKPGQWVLAIGSPRSEERRVGKECRL